MNDASALAATVRHAGSDPSAQVRVEIDGTATSVRVALSPGWRAAVRPSGLGIAVLQAFTAATTARLAAWAEAGALAPAGTAPLGPFASRAGFTAPAAVTQPRAEPVTHADADRVRRAWRDLREFRLRLADLAATAHTVTDPARLVTVTVAASGIVAVELDAHWGAAAPDHELELHLEQALGRGVGLHATFPDRALDGCPDLRTLLDASPVAAHFREPPLPERTLPEPPGSHERSTR
ncbi:MAG: hypothetical protein ACT4RN_21215 [Pseudonocardia sp.]